MNEKLTATEQGLLIELLNGAIAYRIHSGKRRNEIQLIKNIKEKSGITDETIRKTYREEIQNRQDERLTYEKAERKRKKNTTNK